MKSINDTILAIIYWLFNTSYYNKMTKIYWLYKKTHYTILIIIYYVCNNNHNIYKLAMMNLECNQIYYTLYDILVSRYWFYNFGYVILYPIHSGYNIPAIKYYILHYIGCARLAMKFYII